MTTPHLLAAGPGWRVDDVICTAGPHDHPFEERHETVCFALVKAGTFQYRTTQGGAVLVPGAILLGNSGQCFECGHEHGIGDRCLSFHVAPDYFETILVDLPGARSLAFAVPRLPPSVQMLPFAAAAEAALRDGEAAAWEELTLSLAAAISSALVDGPILAPLPARHVERRISETVRHIEAKVHELGEDLSVAALARRAALSPFHFLRAFTNIVGMTPHQFVLRTRLQVAALRLRQSHDTITDIAFGSGFNDLSTFNRRFRQIMGMTPTVFRARRG